MTTLLNETHLPEYQGVIRSIVLVDDRLIKVLFNFWGEDEADIAFSKAYPDAKTAEESVARFLSQSKRLPMAMPGNSSTEAARNIVASKKIFFKELLKNNIALPDNGQGYDFHGDIEYITMIIDYL